MQILKDWYNEHFSDPQVIILFGMILVVGLLVAEFGSMLAPVFASVVIAYLLEGPVRLLERRGAPRLAAVLIVFLLFMFFLVFTLFWLLPLLSNQIAQLVNQVPAMISRGQAELMSLPERYPSFFTEQQVNEWMAALRNELMSMGQRLLSISIASLRSILATLMYMVLMPLLVFFFMKDKSLILNWLSEFMPSQRQLVSAVWEDVDRQIGNYMRGKAWEIILVWVACYATFSLFGLQFAMLLGLGTGLSVLIPYIGAIVITIPVVIISYFQFGQTSDFFWLIGAYGVIHLVDANLLVTMLLSGVVNLHPVAIIMAVLVFGGLWGFWGLFFAIPLATLVRAVLRASSRGKNVPVPEPREPPRPCGQSAA